MNDIQPDAWLYDSITIKSDGRRVESETANTERKNEENWPNERKLYTPSTIIKMMHKIEEENISDTGEKAWKQLKQEMQDKGNETGDSQ